MSTPAVPEATAEKIRELKRIETQLGHLPPEQWALKDLHRRLVDPDFPFHAKQLEQQTEFLFGDICDEMAELGFSPADIADAINSQLQYPGGPRYCSAQEVSEALGLEGGSSQP